MRSNTNIDTKGRIKYKSNVAELQHLTETYIQTKGE